MKNITQQELDRIINLHGKWLRGEKGGKCADLSGYDLSSMTLHSANLMRADLSSSSLESANLVGAILIDANLTHTNLSGADLLTAHLTNANLSNVKLCRADLYYANLTDANLTDANLSNVKLYRTIGDGRRIKSMQIGKYHIAYTSEVLQIGCKQYPIEEWWSFSDEEIEAMDEGALDWWKGMKGLLRTIIETSPAES